MFACRDGLLAQVYFLKPKKRNKLSVTRFNRLYMIWRRVGRRPRVSLLKLCSSQTPDARSSATVSFISTGSDSVFLLIAVINYCVCECACLCVSRRYSYKLVALEMKWKSGLKQKKWVEFSFRFPVGWLAWLALNVCWQQPVSQISKLLIYEPLFWKKALFFHEFKDSLEDFRLSFFLLIKQVAIS